MQQLTLDVELLPHATFANFVANQALVEYFQHTTESLCLIAPVGEGVTHLLQASCHQSTTPALYLPLRKHKVLAPEILQGSRRLSLVVIDDIEEIAGNLAWETALFHAFNEAQMHQTRLLFGAHCVLQQCPFILPDFYSRLKSLTQLNLQPLTEQDKAQILHQQAQQRGFELSSKIVHYLLKNQTRDLSTLLTLLDQVANLSLQKQRRITLPLLKQLFEG